VTGTGELHEFPNFYAVKKKFYAVKLEVYGEWEKFYAVKEKFYAVKLALLIKEPVNTR
jgi:hypothetical protein